MTDANLARSKRTLAAECFRRMGEAVAKAPFVPLPSAPDTPDDLLTALFNGVGEDMFVMTVRDPTAEDGTIQYCLLCQSEAHAPSCPVEVLNRLYDIGIDSSKTLPANVGLDPMPEAK